ncbi:MAG: hypothetical protein KDL87_17905, partial [Verrucomicrobiae bacterium]|nr:hypothetical protein [Verrucomicrobiae bacterium]
ETLPAEAFEARNESRRLLLAQSYRIADGLESEGIKAYGASKLSLVGVCSGEVVELPDFRNIVFIPAVAQRKRHQMLKQLEYFLQRHPFSRMWVFTSGERAALGEVRERIERLHRRLSKLNAEPFMKSAGARIVFRSTELGDVTRSETAEATFHIHAHTIVHLRAKLDPERWSYLLQGVHAWWKHHFDDSKRIHQAREVCKYVVKPGDLDSLRSWELVELHRQLFKLHLVQCLGPLRDQRREIEETGCKLVRRSNGERTWWDLVANWNGGRRGDDETSGTKDYSEAPEDWVICTLPPSFALSNRSEPLAVVLNYRGARLGENRRIRQIRESCQGLFGG